MEQRCKTKLRERSHLKSGTGNPWDWHNKTIGIPARFFNPVLE